MSGLGQYSFQPLDQEANGATQPINRRGSDAVRPSSPIRRTSSLSHTNSKKEE